MYTSNFARLRQIPNSLRPVSIARGTPRWFRGLRYEPLAPEWEWLRASREEYDRAFRQRLNQLDPDQVYQELGDNAVLLCWCKHNAGCHRRLVSEWLERNLGIVIPEWGYPRSECQPYAACWWEKRPLARGVQGPFIDEGRRLRRLGRPPYILFHRVNIAFNPIILQK